MSLICLWHVLHWEYNKLKTTALFEPHFLPAHCFSISQHTTDSGGVGWGERGRREVMTSAVAPFSFAKIASWQIWFLKFLMFC